MDKIEEYVETMFSTLPKTKDAIEMKLGIIESMQDRYSELMEQGKSKEEALGTVISQFGSVEELRRELAGQEGPAPTVQSPCPPVNPPYEYTSAPNQYQTRRHKANIPAGPIFMAATIIFLLLGFIWDAWHPGWLVFLLASFVVTLLKWFQQEKSVE